MPIRRLVQARHAYASNPLGTDSCPLSLRWAFSIMLDLGGHRQLIQRHGFNDDGVATELGLGELVDADEFDAALALRQLKRARKAFDQPQTMVGYPDRLAQNLATLGRLLGLDDNEQRLFGFCVMMHTDSTLSDAAEMLGSMGYNRTLRALSVLLDIPQQALPDLLSREGRLVRSGLLSVTITNSIMATLPHRLSIDSQDFLGMLRFGQERPIDLFRHAFRLAPPGELQVGDYEHLGSHMGIATGHLKRAVAARSTGVNVLVYGPPGTGKTQLSRLLASLVETPLYEIACTDSDGNPIGANERLGALRSAMSVLHDQRALVVLDEIEDIFESQPLPFASMNKSRKGWINRMLEENPVPCFWLSNSIEALDNAYIRRFDLVLELPNPPRKQRERIIRDASGDRLGQALVKKLVEHEEMTPAVVTRAVQIGRGLHPRSSRALDATVETLVSATLKAQGFVTLDQSAQPALPEFYSPGLVNTDLPLEGLLGGLRQNPEARLCFYGPPGTGKTAFGHWLAQQLEKPLMVKRVSDLVAPFVGETEQNLARAFAAAQLEDAVLLFDEVDSFLQDRKKARQSWEITAVNEMLTQMESYQGLFIASTNLMQDLDEASIRRFDLKIHFDYLKPQQIRDLFTSHLKAMKLKDPAGSAVNQLLGEGALTPGDFALVARRARFQPFATAQQMAVALIQEVRLKRQTQRPIGFVH
ncbi:ATPase [Stutzerimonas stutzeri]|uniref:AAA family ATPase n=1 Tax=Stutzerimonas stutzeri subgroup TaxID=578833 RepID=UPI0005B3EAFE|nr:AAA family ATPase [Stutzerimonas kunmingensis]KKJ95399.1 ATPase [Stutzerimonas stutzeri]MAF86298.1 ATPase [Pseudomonas sp.]MAK87441.1 ATPase [Pseudomonas sp.]MBD3876289.1 ATP-binding protein [Stutzerimonas kunmingensis]HCH75434.1 ATPase [Pseudomonas sp.]